MLKEAKDDEERAFIDRIRDYEAERKRKYRAKKRAQREACAALASASSVVYSVGVSRPRARTAAPPVLALPASLSVTVFPMKKASARQKEAMLSKQHNAGSSADIFDVFFSQKYGTKLYRVRIVPCMYRVLTYDRSTFTNKYQIYAGSVVQH